MEEKKSINEVIDENVLNFNETPRHIVKKNQSTIFDFENVADEKKKDVAPVSAKEKEEEEKENLKQEWTPKIDSVNIIELYEKIKEQKLQEKARKEYFSNAVKIESFLNQEKQILPNTTISNDAPLSLASSHSDESDNLDFFTIDNFDSFNLSQTITQDSTNADIPSQESAVDATPINEREIDIDRVDAVDWKNGESNKLNLNEQNIDNISYNNQKKLEEQSILDLFLPDTDTEIIDINKVEVVNLAKYKRNNRYLFTREMRELPDIQESNVKENVLDAAIETSENDIISKQKASQKVATPTLPKHNFDIDSVDVDPNYVGNFAKLYKKVEASADIGGQETSFLPFDIDVQAIKPSQSKHEKIVNFYNAQTLNIDDASTESSSSRSTTHTPISLGWIDGLKQAFKRLPQKAKQLIFRIKAQNTQSTQSQSFNSASNLNDINKETTQTTNQDFEYSKIQVIDRANE